MTENFKSVSVIIPVLNEESILEAALERVTGALNLTNFRYEVIVVDDGSTDRTWSILQEHCKKNDSIKALRLSKNFGHDAAVFIGMKHAVTEAIITMDCDGQHPFELLPEIVKLWSDTSCDIVNTVKVDRGNESVLYRIAVKLFGRVLSNVMQVELINATEFKLLSARARDALLECGDHHYFYRALVPWIGFKQLSFPITVGVGMREGRHWNFISLVNFAVSGLVMFSDFPIRVMLWIGIAVLGLCTVLLFKLLITFVAGEVPVGYSTLLFMSTLNAGLLMTGLGVIGIYLKTTLNQTKRRPRAIVSDASNIKYITRYI